MKEQRIIGKSRPFIFRRWWLKTRILDKEPCGKVKIQNGEWKILPCKEVYVPWYAWPLELMHRVIFGRAKLEPINDSE